MAALTRLGDKKSQRDRQVHLAHAAMLARSNLACRGDGPVHQFINPSSAPGDGLDEFGSCLGADRRLVRSSRGVSWWNDLTCNFGRRLAPGNGECAGLQGALCCRSAVGSRSGQTTSTLSNGRINLDPLSIALDGRRAAELTKSVRALRSLERFGDPSVFERPRRSAVREISRDASHATSLLRLSLVQDGGYVVAVADTLLQFGSGRHPVAAIIEDASHENGIGAGAGGKRAVALLVEFGLHGIEYLPVQGGRLLAAQELALLLTSPI